MQDIATITSLLSSTTRSIARVELAKAIGTNKYPGKPLIFAEHIIKTFKVLTLKVTTDIRTSLVNEFFGGWAFYHPITRTIFCLSFIPETNVHAEVGNMLGEVEKFASDVEKVVTKILDEEREIEARDKLRYIAELSALKLKFAQNIGLDHLGLQYDHHIVEQVVAAKADISSEMAKELTEAFFGTEERYSEFKKNVRYLHETKKGFEDEERKEIRKRLQFSVWSVCQEVRSLVQGILFQAGPQVAPGVKIETPDEVTDGIILENFMAVPLHKGIEFLAGLLNERGAFLIKRPEGDLVRGNAEVRNRLFLDRVEQRNELVAMARSMTEEQLINSQALHEAAVTLSRLMSQHLGISRAKATHMAFKAKCAEKFHETNRALVAKLRTPSEIMEAVARGDMTVWNETNVAIDKLRKAFKVSKQ